MTDDHNLKERTKHFALRVIRLFGSLPKSSEAQVLGKQLLSSGTSGANYREAYRARSKSEFIAKCGDSLLVNLRSPLTGLNYSLREE